MKKVLIVGIVLVLLSCTGVVSAATVGNGGFENPGTFSGDIQTLTAPSSVLTPWSVDANSIDLINTYWPAHTGSYSIDLAGLAPGTISQTIDTQNGETCDLTFWMAGNQDLQGQKSVHVFWGADEVPGSPFTFISTPKGTPMGWAQKSSSGLTATGPTTITFVADSGSGAYGPALDDIAVVCTGNTPIPEFPSIALPAALIVGLIGAVLFIRNFRDN